MGFKNNYFLGFTVLFGILFIFHILYGSYELYINSVESFFDIKTQFGWYTLRNDFIGQIINNQMRPAYLVFYFLINCVLAAQIYPLEKANNWNKNYGMKFIVICGFSVWLLFIPIIGTSPFAIIPVLLAFIGIGVGFLLNIYIFVVLYRKATGDLKKRALYNVLAFLFLALGLLIAMEVGIIASFSSQISYRWEVTIGSILQLIGAIFYNRGFQKMESISEKANNQIKRKEYHIIDNLKGYFTKHQLLNYIVIFTTIGFLFLGLARLTYPIENQYSIFKDTISFLGSSDLDNNPKGWWLLSISLYILGCILIPLAIYRFRRMSLIKRPLAIISFFFYLIASLGFILIATFPDNGGTDFFGGISAGRMHYIVALFAFIGFAIAFLFDFFIFVIDRFTTKILNPTLWIIVYILFFILVGIGGYTQLVREFICESNCWPGEGIYSFPLWEWILFFIIFGVLYSVLLSLPNDLDTLKERNKFSG